MENGGFVLIGKVHSAQGIKGELYISIFAEEAAWVDQWEEVHLSQENENAPSLTHEIDWWREHAKQKRWGYVVRLKDIKNRNQAEELVGMKVYIPEAFLVSQEGESMYLREVLGFRVIDESRGDVGEIIGFSGSDFQDLLVIENEKGVFEVPFVEPILKKMDKDNKQLLMDIPFGWVVGEEL